MYSPCPNIIPSMLLCNSILHSTLHNSALNTANNISQNTIQASTQNVFSNIQAMNQQATGACFIDYSHNIDNAPISQMDIKYLENAYFIQTAYDRAINQFGKTKPRLTIYDLDRLIFPEDPIRDWVTKRVAEIEKKFAWADQL